jgi:mannose-6-phosphate isomerase-like protein (cupin superfamily)
MKGSGTLQIGRQEATLFPFVPGDVLFVPAGKHHRFVEFTPDLITWAIFWGPPGGE